uniref:Xylulose kinase-1 n=1 Tax=Tanacetum cinerariifolium TaxID=118510 RepID=A0A6L2KR50_TANCI|nr:hypothetical protein [Tanacetum cinerariifolium]
MVACFEKIEENSEFHEIVDFFTSSMIHHALTISPTMYTSYIEQFWNTASSQTINDEKQIHDAVDSKAVVVTEASISSSLLVNDVDGTACLTNEAIFQNLALIDYEDNPKKKFLMHPKILMVFLNNQIELGEPFNDVYTAPAHNLKAAEIIALKARIKKLEKKCTPSISYHKAWLKSVQRLSMKKRFGKKEFVSKQGRKKDKPEPTLDDSTFDGLDADHGIDSMDTEEPVNEGRLSEKTEELKWTLILKKLHKTMAVVRKEEVLKK